MDMLTLIAASWLSAAQAPAPPPSALTSTPLLMAQAGGPPPQRGERRQRPARKDPSVLAAEIGLDAVQSEQFVAILNEQRSKHEALRERNQAQRGAAREAHQSIDEETFVRLSTVLSTEQLAKFHANRPPPPEKRRRSDGRGRGGRT